MLRAEEDELGVLADLHRVARGPDEQISGSDLFLCAVLVDDGECALDEVAPSAVSGIGCPRDPRAAV